MHASRIERTLFAMHATLGTHNKCNMPGRTDSPTSFCVRQRMGPDTHLKINDVKISV
jgi:hypothetical protein